MEEERSEPELTVEQKEELSKLAPVFLSELDSWENETDLARHGMHIPASWYEPVKVMCQQIESINKQYPQSVIYATMLRADGSRLSVDLSMVNWPLPEDIMGDIADRIDKALTEAEQACAGIAEETKDARS